MAESSEKLTSDIWEIFKWISDSIKEFFDKIKAILGIKEKTEEELAGLRNEVLWLNEWDLENKKLSDKEKKVLDNISGNYPDFKNWREWMDTWVSDDFKYEEFEKILKVLKELEKNDKKLDKNEMEWLVKACKDKMDLCKEVEEKIKTDDALKDKNITKEQIIKAYNKCINNWWNVTKDKVIETLKNENS